MTRTTWKHARTWLVSDVASAVPLALTLGTPWVFLRLVRLVVVFQYSWLFHYVDRNSAFSAATFRLFRLFLFYVFLAHVLSCCYWRIATQGDRGRYGGAAWWAVPDAIEDAALGHKWLFCAAKTLTLLLGEDTEPMTGLECAFVCSTISLGVFGLSVVIGQVTLVAQDVDAIGRKKTEQVDAVLLYLRYRGVPADVREEIVRFIEYMWNSGQAEHETAGLETLPDSLKLRLDLALKQQLIKGSAEESERRTRRRPACGEVEGREGEPTRSPPWPRSGVALARGRHPSQVDLGDDGRKRRLR